MRKGLLLVLSAPAGAGKGSLKDLLLARDAGFRFSVSATTRKPRPGETDGIHYVFLDEDVFAQMEANGDFLEVATVHGHRYGTPLKPIMQWIENGQDILLEIDTQGALSVMEKLADCVSVFVLPPSFEELERRLRTRGTEEEECLQRRLRNGREEVKALSRYRYVIINDTLEVAYRKLEAIIMAERHNTVRFKPNIE